MLKNLYMKRIFFILVIVCISLGVYGIIGMLDKEQTIQVNALPMTNKTIILDARTWAPE